MISGQRPAHERQIQDLPELLARLRDRADDGEAAALVQVNRGGVARFNGGDHGAIARPA